jgi:hypothetical protein
VRASVLEEEREDVLDAESRSAATAAEPAPDVRESSSDVDAEASRSFD